MSYSLETASNLTTVSIDYKKLKQQCRNSKKKWERGTKKKVYAVIFIQEFAGGIALLYYNGSDSKYTEQLEFDPFENLEI